MFDTEVLSTEKGFTEKPVVHIRFLAFFYTTQTFLPFSSPVTKFLL